MANERSKVVFYGETLIDLTGDTVTPADLKKGMTAHDKNGAQITGTNTNDLDTSEATAAAAEILDGKTAGAGGKMLTGTMPNNGAVKGSISTKAGTYKIPFGCHDGSGTVGIASAEQEKLIPENIKQGVKVLGVTGTYSGKAVKLQSKTVTPGTTEQTVTADSGYDALSSVVVAKIPYSETENASGGITVTIG